MAELYIPIWMRGTPLEDIYKTAWTDTGDPVMALETVRESPVYESFFAGNRREDGTLRYEEGVYLSIRESFDDSLLSIGLNPDLFQARYPELIAGLVSPAEFTTRIEQVYDGIIDRTPQIAEYYANNYGIDLTTEAIVASFIDPDIGDQIMQGRIEIAQVGGAAAQRGFNIVQSFAEQLRYAGMDTESEAAQFFALAEGVLPTLTAMARRHDDPDDDFTLEEFAAASVFTDPAQRQRMRRIMSQERSTFSQNALGPVALSDQGTSQGLYER